ncbi:MULTISPECIES: hypothetical protein [Dyella]|uniref:Vitamin B12 transport system permease protein n=2 Tax=Dyella TaxID=231454 RepID=A0A4R0YPG1_9GAMM|nr:MULTISPECIES: hypothetical protein [Dyella]TBR37247.1 hypothetical protein EYV96_15325 [Dyella terrae]TCI07663.1 hypothetical protein EZM97_23545 [Dyella soli]
MSARNPLVVLFSVFSALMLGMAAGAVWMLPTLYMQRPLPFLAIPFGWMLGRAIRSWIRPDRQGATVLAILATMLACAYVGVLTSAARIAGSMGLGLVDAMKTAGFGLLWQLTRLNWSGQDWVWFCAGVALAAVAAGRPARQRSQAG